MARHHRLPAKPWLRALALFAPLIAVWALSYSPVPGADDAESAPLPLCQSVVSPGQAKKVSCDAGVLDVAAVAVAAPTTLGIAPLTETELPALDQGMTNVTLGPRRGYRFFPHGMKFKSNIRVSLPYNPALIPPGLSEQDIKTFYFDDQSGSWIELQREMVDTRGKRIISITDHFTDMVNATVTVPDHPEPLSLNPTAMKDLKAADPGAGINLIAPPQVNSTGDARLSYAIELPPGRAGVQPNLSVDYSSSAENGWLGLGWDLQLQSVMIDTRWGVPRYDAALETETYLLDGQQLTPLAHRGALRPRAAERIFHTRVEGQFLKIQRHGDAPDNYWWEVTDKGGHRFFYGGDSGTGALAADSVLSDPSGANVFRWMLREMRDANGNSMRFHYDIVNGGGGGEEPWRQIYLRRITYTGRFATEGAYEVELFRESGRPDVIVDGRPGFKTVLDQRLARIDVRLTTEANPLIRRYQFSYGTGQFSKSLLTRVAQLGQDGVTEFNHHDFEYFDDVATASPDTLDGFRAAPGISGATVLPDDFLLLGTLVDADSTAFGADDTTHEQTHFYGGVAVGSAKEVSAGAKVGTQSSETITHLTLTDLNGDGLLDQLYRSGASFFYRPNTGGPVAAPNFGPQVALASLTSIGAEIGHETSSTRTIGAQEFVTALGLLQDFSRTRTRGDIYLNDVNADQLPDLVVGGNVFFNRLVAGVPTFAAGSPTPLETGAPADASGLVTDAEAGKEDMEREYHLVDPLRRWTAPYSGTISITGDVRLLSAAGAGYATADGIRASVQRNGTELWSETIGATDLAAHAIGGLGSVAVSAGDRIYFRLHSINDGAFDAAEFNPTITYTGTDTSRVDENGMPIFVYNAESDYAYGGRALPFVTPFNGTATLAGDLDKPSATTDDITLQVKSAGTVVHTQTIAFGSTGTFAVSVPLTTVANSQIEVHILSDSRIDLSDIRFAPTLAYDTIEGNPAPTDGLGDPLIVFTPPVTARVYPRNLTASAYSPFVAPQDGLILVTQGVSVLGGVPSDYDADVTLTIKRPGTRLAKQRVEVRNGTIPGTDALIAFISVSEDDVLYFEADAFTEEESPDALDAVSITAPFVTYLAPSVVPLGPQPFDAHEGLSPDEPFGGGFRYWSFGQYNGRDGGVAVDETRLRLPPDCGNSQACRDEQREVARDFVGMVPFLDEDHWRAEDEECFIGATTMSASRLGINFLDFPDGSGFGGARGVVRYGGADSFAVGAFVLSFGAGVTEGSNWSDIDFFDFNGDRYPDVVGGGKVQSTLPNGALDANRADMGAFDRVREGESEVFNVNLGATTSGQITNSRGKLQAISTEQAAYNLSLGLDGNRGEFDTSWDLVDINGDGLPDYVRKGSPGLEVRLNLGYRFGEPENWGDDATLRFEQSAGVGLSGGLGVTTGSYSFGGGFATTLSTAGAEQDLVDVNGDGLLDIVSKDLDFLVNSDAPLRVRFNTGNGFTGEHVYSGALEQPLRANATLGENLGLHFTIAIPIPFTPISIILNPGHYEGASRGGFEVMLSDLDGDGYADHIFSDRDGNVAVKLNNHGRTNLLKTVRRPLGGRFDLDYARSGNTTDQPGNRWVLAETRVFDGFAGDGDADLGGGVFVTQKTTYTFEDGFYDRAEREFYGFRTVREQHRDPANGDALYREIVRTYFNDSFYTRGLMESEALQDALGRKFTEAVNIYDVVTVADGAGAAGLEDFTETRFPQLVRTDRNFYEGNPAPGKSTHTQNEYDAIGNVVRMFDAGDATPADDIEALVEYSACTAINVIGTPVSIRVNGDGTEMRRREATIDCANGNITQIRQHLTGGDVATSDIDYFDNGNLERVTGPENAEGDRYEIAYEYDGVVVTHVTRITDSFGYSSLAAHNLKFAQPSRTEDINGNATTYVYDAFGRLSGITGPYEQGGPTKTLRFSYSHDAVVPWALTRHIDSFRSATDTIDTATFTDGFKRVLQTKKDGTVHTGPNSAASERMIVSGRVTFDFAGRTTETFYPVTEPTGTPGVFNPAYDSVQPTRTEYDVMDRARKTTMPDNTSNETSFGFGPDRGGATQFQTTATDANGVSRDSFRDVRNLTTSITEFNNDGAQAIWTSYAYDAMQQLVRIVDDQGNATLAEYDKLGRRTAIDSPDGGRTEMVYDLASNMTAKVTANLRAGGKHIDYDYDFNRVETISYPDFPGNNVRYEYGDPGASDNRAGRVTEVTDESGKEERFYGKLGEVTKEINTIASDTQGNSGNAPEVYTTQYLYDTWGRLQTLTYPDGEVLTYRYDSGGMVRAASGAKSGYTYAYLSRLEYDKFQQRAFMEAANNVRTSFTYDPLDRRLVNVQAGKSGGNPFQNLQYTYDDVGNVLTLNNDVPVPPPSQYGGPTTQSFQYDDLYRLTSASGSYAFSPGKLNRYTLTTEYDTIHNIVGKTQTNDVVQPSGVAVPQHKTSFDFDYAYDGAQPHAPTHIGDRAFSYDANGNQAGWTHDQNGTRREIVWDEEDRIQSIFDNGHEKTYKYDAEGERVIKRGPQGETVYVNGFFTVRNREIGTKHIYAGQTRLVSKLMKQNKPGANPGGGTPFEKDSYFYHADHIGSSNYVTDANGKLYEHLEYFPSGEAWVQESSNTQRTPYLFTSKELDEETGLYYYGARYYDPRTGVFTTNDPVVIERPESTVDVPATLNTYAYALQNPIQYVDPDGREAKPFRFIMVEVASKPLSKDLRKFATARVQSELKLLTKASTNATVKKGFDVKYRTKDFTAEELAALGPRDFVVYIVRPDEASTTVPDLVKRHISPRVEDLDKKIEKIVSHVSIGGGKYYESIDDGNVGRVAIAPYSPSSPGFGYKPKHEGPHLGEIALHEGIGHAVLGNQHSEGIMAASSGCCGKFGKGSNRIPVHFTPEHAEAIRTHLEGLVAD
jgi:RHS repeat-associated protein